MPETKSVVFSYREVVEALLRYNNIHEGLWGIYIEFGIAGANISFGPAKELTPAAIVPIAKLGIQRFEEPNDLTVDAAKVNPPAKTKAK